MKTLRLAAVAAMFLASAAAFATHPPAPPPPAPSPPAPPSSTSTSGSTSGAAAGSSSISGAKAGADANSSASARQDQGQGQKQGQASTMTDASSSSTRSGFYVFPQLAFTPPLPMLECPMARTKQSSTGVLFGAVSHAESSSDGDRCFSVTLYNDFIANCQYESARRFKVQMAVDVYPKFVPANDSVTLRGQESLDLTPSECAALKAPVVAQVAPSIREVPAPIAPAAASAPVKPAKKTAAAKASRKCDRKLVGVWQCERQPEAALATKGK